MKFKLITVSKNEDQKIIGIDTIPNNVYHIAINNNNQPLPKIYNKYLGETRKNNDADFLIFMHADVFLDIKHLLNHIVECKDKYDVMGLCGTSILNVSQSPLNWWTASNPTPQAKWGCVTHGELGNQTSFFNQHSPDITDHEVACIDGLCIIFGPKAIQSEMMFDDQFIWDFYDTDISLQTILKYNMKLGVLVERSLQHYSVGRSILTQDFLTHEIDFRKKWKFDIPPNSAIEKMIAEKH